MSANLEQVEQRLTLVEATLTQVQHRLGLSPHLTNWVEQISGSLADIPEEDYHQFLDSCRAVRNAEPSVDEEKPQA
jgi:folylpolyglutamate synthase/dihydropteroate synthase